MEWENLAVVEIKSLTKEDRKQEALSNWTINFEAGTINALCTNEPNSINILFALLLGQEKIMKDAIHINGLDAYKQRKKLAAQIGYQNEEVVLAKHGDILQLLTTTIKKSDQAVTLEQAKQIVNQFGIKLNARVADLAQGQKQQLGIIMMTIQKLPLLLLEQATSLMDDSQRKATWQLLHDYVQKMNATVLFASERFDELQRFADQIVYIRNGKITNQRELPTHDSVDCMVTIMGTGFPIELAESLGAHIIQEAQTETKLIFSGNIQVLLPLLEKTTITDVRIQDAEIDDELMIF